MNFRQVATEIMLHAGDEKWYETRDKIERALEDAQLTAEVEFCDNRYRPKHPLLEREAFWRDQPDGVR